MKNFFTADRRRELILSGATISVIVILLAVMIAIQDDSSKPSEGSSDQFEMVRPTVAQSSVWNNGAYAYCQAGGWSHDITDRTVIAIYNKGPEGSKDKISVRFRLIRGATTEVTDFQEIPIPGGDIAEMRINQQSFLKGVEFEIEVRPADKVEVRVCELESHI